MSPTEGGLGHDVVVLTEPKSSSRSEVESTAMYGDDVMARVKAAVAAHEQEGGHDTAAGDVGATLLEFAKDAPSEDDNTVVLLSPTGAHTPYTEATEDEEDHHTLTKRPTDLPPQASDLRDTMFEAELPESVLAEVTPELSATGSAYDATYDPTAIDATAVGVEDDAAAASSSAAQEDAAQTMISGEYISSDSLLKDGAGATSMYIPTSAILEAVKVAEANAGDMDGVSEGGESREELPLIPSFDAESAARPSDGMADLFEAAAIDKTTEAADFIDLSDGFHGDDGVATQVELPEVTEDEEEAPAPDPDATAQPVEESSALPGEPPDDRQEAQDESSAPVAETDGALPNEMRADGTAASSDEALSVGVDVGAEAAEANEVQSAEVDLDTESGADDRVEPEPAEADVLLPFATSGEGPGDDVTSTMLSAVPDLSAFEAVGPDATVASVPSTASAEVDEGDDVEGEHQQEASPDDTRDAAMAAGTDEHGAFSASEDASAPTGADTSGGSEPAPVSPVLEAEMPGPMKPDERQKLNATLMFGVDVSAIPGLDDAALSGAPSAASQSSPYADADPYDIRDTQKVSDDFDEALAGQEGVAVAVKAIFGDEPSSADATEAEQASAGMDPESPQSTPDEPAVAISAPVADHRSSPLNATMAFGVYQPPEEASTAAKAPAAKEKKRRDRRNFQQTMAIDNVAEKMAEMAAMAEAQQVSAAPSGHDSTLAFGPSVTAAKTSRRVSLGQTMAMDALEIQQWAEDMGVAPEAPVDEKVDDATEQLARAERAVDEERYPEAIELYLALMKAFPAERHYQERLEHVWSLLREREISSLELPAVPVGTAAAVTNEQLPWSGKQQKKIHLYWGMSLLLLLVVGGVLGFVWPGWLRGTTGPSPVGVAKRPASGLSSMQINSTPIGASIWLNGENTGHKTPMTLQKKPGRYALALRLEGYRPLKKTIALKPGMAFAIEFALAPQIADPAVDAGPGPAVAPPVVARRIGRKARRRGKKATHTRLRLRSRPSGAAITINERATGRKTPATIKLPVGRYQIQLQRRGYQTYIRDVTLRYRRQRLRVRLVRASSQAQTRISVVTRPPGATIAIDGKTLDQTTPATFPVSAQTLVLTLSKKGYRTSNQKLSLKPGETRRVEISLRKKGPAGMVYVRSGAFWMGNNAGIAREKPMRKVKMRGFYIDRYEVSVAQYKACVAAGKCRKASRKRGCNAGKKGRDNHPINCVSWYDAAKYCRWAGKRLPTEAEWEKAARGPSTQLYPWGHSSPSCRTATYGRRCGGFGTSRIGIRKGGRSPYGAYDMAGNVWEWVADYFDRNYYNKASNANPYNRFRGSGYRVIRGGAWNTRSDQLHVSYRLEYWPTRRTNSIGFRCAR